MKNFFSEVDDITLTFSDIQTNTDGMENIRIYFERPAANGFDFLETVLPSLIVKKALGFNAFETKKLLEYARTNAFLIWEIAREGADGVAASR